MNRHRRKAYLALLTTALIWGLAPPIIKYTLRFISPLTFLFYRFLIVSTILFIPLIWKIKKEKLNLKKSFQYLALGFLGTPLTLLFLFYGMQKTAAINASLISIFTPLLIILGGVVFLKETVTRQERLGISFIFGGALLSVIEPIFKNGVNLSQGLTGNLLILAGSLAWASFSLLRRKVGERLDSFILSASSFLVGLVIVTLAMAIVNPAQIFHFSLFAFNLNALPGVFYMAILGSVIAYFTYIYGFSKIEASEATLFTYLEPVFAIPIAVFFLQEKPSSLFLLGAFLIVVGVLASQTRKLKLPRLLIFETKRGRP